MQITKETAKLAQEKGFDLICHNVYRIDIDDKECYEHKGAKNGTDKLITAPSQFILQKWFREIHDIHINPEPYRETADHTGDITGYYMGEIRRGCKGELLNVGDDNYATYEEALEAGLLFALHII